MKKLLIIPLVILLSACNPTENQYRWFTSNPDRALFYCPVIKHFPNWNTLTEKQVASTIRTLQKNNITCKSNINQIKKFIDDSNLAINSE